MIYYSGSSLGAGVNFRERLLADLPRGVSGKPDSDVAAQWGDVEKLPPKFGYGRDSENGKRGVFLGYNGLPSGKPLGFTDDRHVLTIAGSRAGKGRSLIIPNLLLYEGSVLAIDPKGELARVTSRARAAMGQKVFVLDPFGASLQDCKSDKQRDELKARLASYNPLADLDPNSRTFVDDAQIIANALVKDGDGDRFWTESARVLVRALILFAFTLAPEHRHLVTVRNLLTLNDPLLTEIANKNSTDPQTVLWELLKLTGEKTFGGLIAATGATFSKMHENGLSSVLATARTETAFLDSPLLQDTLTKSDFALRDLKRGAATVYLCLPAGRMASHSNWLRIFIDLALQAFEQDMSKPPAPLLMVLDEFPVLGYMRSLEAAAGQIAGFGVKLWTVIQDITQLKRLYKDSWETFVGNAGVVTAFGNTDGSTLRYLSDQLGNVTMDIIKESGASAAQTRAGALPTQKQIRDAPLLAPHELAELFGREKGRLLVMAAGLPPLAILRAIYDKDEPFSGSFDP